MYITNISHININTKSLNTVLYHDWIVDRLHQLKNSQSCENSQSCNCWSCLHRPTNKVVLV